MESWLVNALLSMLFAGLTAVIAKLGLAQLAPDIGMVVRTAAVALCVAVFALTTTRAADYLALEPKHWMWLTLSGAAAAASWVFYFRAIYAGEVSKVVLIDKASVVIALLGAWWLLGESITAQKAVGAGLILAGLVVIARS